MADLIPVTLEDGITVHIEAAESATLPGVPVIREAGAEDAAEKAIEIGRQLSGSIKSFCGRIISSLHELEEVARPSKVGVEFGLNISAEGNVYFVKGTAGASVKIIAEWQLDARGS